MKTTDVHLIVGPSPDESEQYLQFVEKTMKGEKTSSLQIKLKNFQRFLFHC